MIEKVADKVADKIYTGIQFFFESKIEALSNILPELMGLGIIVCGVLLMFGDLKKGLARTGIVAIIGTTLAVLL